MKNKIYFCTFIFLIILGTDTLSSQNKINSSSEIKELIAKKRAFNKKYGAGFTVQIFYGDETNARTSLNKFKIDFPEVFTKLDYNQPYWSVQVGNYKTKLEADKAIIRFSEKFSGLIVIPLGK